MANDIAWYHTIELPDGTLTAGLSDTRSALQRIPFPASLEGKRCLDIGTADGFWAFSMEKRGAREVVAIDVDDPHRRDWPWGITKDIEGPGRRSAFETARNALGSSVVRKDVSIYEVSEGQLGRFDFIFIGDLLLHLRDPVRALAAVRSVLDGELLLNDVISLSLTLQHPVRRAALFEARAQPRWWIPNASGLRAMVGAAGYEVIDSGRPYFAKFGPGAPPKRALLKAVRSGGLRRLPRGLGQRFFGAPHIWVRARVRGVISS
jgi:SAM-dependent methyltransferase